VAGYGLFVALMVVGYYYNITFVQLGLIDLGTRLVGTSETAVSIWMASLALVTLVVAVVTGVTMDRRGWSTDLRTKLRLLFGVVCLQFGLTLVAPMIRTVPGFGTWIVLASIGLGVGFPVSFSLAIDLVPVPDRGYVAAAITAIAYFFANAIPLSWSIDVFSQLMVAAMVPGILVLAVLSFVRFDRLDAILGAFGWWLVERHPLVIENVGAAITEHALVNAVVGSLGATTLLVLFVYMAFTLILLPLAIVGLFVEFLVILYGQAVFGYLIGRRLPIERDGVATLAGIAAFLLALELVGLIPYLGGIAQLTVAVVGFGAVLNTYFGLQRFEPITIPGGT